MENLEKKHYIEFRKLFIEKTQEVASPGGIGLAMSGGIDSMSIFFSLIELDFEFECYTFYQEGYKSEDLKASIKYCKYFNIPINIIELKSDIDSIYKDIVDVIPFCGEKIKKTKVETLRPLMHLFKQSHHKIILNGSSADDYQPYKRKVNIDYMKGGDGLVLKKGHRLGVNDKYDSFDPLSQEMAKFYGVNFINVYADKSIEDFFLRFPLKQILYPHKHLVTSAFEDYFNKIGGFRLHSPYQINSKTSEFHELLLESKYNKRSSKAVIAIYNDIALDFKNKQTKLF